MRELHLGYSAPPRSQLYAPEPVGIHTGMIESLASYVRRIADHHFVSATDLMHSMICLFTEDHVLQKDRRIYNLMRLRSRELNGTQQIAAQWSRLVGQQTARTNIDQLTLLPWRNLLTMRALLHQGQPWCPQCLDEWRKHDTSLYWPLLWSLRCVTVCPQHHIQLEHGCHNCNAVVPSLSAHGHIGFCAKCNAWLGYLERSPRDVRMAKAATLADDLASKLASSASELLMASPLIQKPPTIAKLVRLLDHCMHSANCRQVVLARYLNISSETLSRLMNGQDHMNVPMVLTLLAHLGVTVKDFAAMPTEIIVGSGQLDPFIASLPNKTKPAIKTRLMPGQYAKPDLLADVQQILELALQEDDPPGLPTLAYQVGLTTVKVFWHHYPHLCRAIIQKRKSRFDIAKARQLMSEFATSSDMPPPLTTIAAQLQTSLVYFTRA